MKYSIEGFGQERAVELGLTAEDLVLLRWFVDFYGTGKMVKHLLPDGVYAWVNYKAVLEQLPIIKCNKRNLTARFERLVDAGVLTHKTIKQGGTFAVYGFGPEYDGLIYEQKVGQPTAEIELPTSEIELPTSEIEPPPRPKSDHPYVRNQTTPTSKFGRTKIILQEDSSTKDSSIKDKKENAASEQRSDIEKEFETLWSLYPKKQGKDRAKKSYLKARKGHPEIFELVRKGIESYVAYLKAKKTEEQFIKQGGTWFYQNCWEDDYSTEGKGNSNGRNQGYPEPDAGVTNGFGTWL